MIEFFVPGRPQTAGSKTAIPTAAGARVIEAGSRQSRLAKRSWRGDLRDGANNALDRYQQLDGVEWNRLLPMTLIVVIVRKRAATHLRSNGAVKDWAQDLLPVQRPDTVKQVRAAEDALTGVLWADDSQLVEHYLFKAYGDQCGLTTGAEGMLVQVRVCDSYRGPRERG